MVRKQIEEQFREGLLGVRIKGHDAVNRMDPRYFEALKRYYIDLTINRKSAILARKFKEMIIMAIAAARGGRIGVELHMRRALLSGASPKEILEALQTAAIPGGLPVLWMGSEVLESELKKLKIKFS